MGHWALGMGHWAWGIGEAVRSWGFPKWRNCRTRKGLRHDGGLANPKGLGVSRYCVAGWLDKWSNCPHLPSTPLGMGKDEEEKFCPMPHAPCPMPHAQFSMPYFSLLFAYSFFRTIFIDNALKGSVKILPQSGDFYVGKLHY